MMRGTQTGETQLLQWQYALNMGGDMREKVRVLQSKSLEKKGNARFSVISCKLII